MQLPWVLTHKDLSDTNILVDPVTGCIHGVIDWENATIESFGLALIGVYSILGTCSLDKGYQFACGDKSPRYRRLFAQTLSAEIGGLSATQETTIEAARVLSILVASYVGPEDALTKKFAVKDVVFWEKFYGIFISRKFEMSLCTGCCTNAALMASTTIRLTAR